jgi:hypothetical protein
VELADPQVRCWHQAEVSAPVPDVRYEAQSGLQLRAAHMSAFDPKRTFGYLAVRWSLTSACWSSHHLPIAVSIKLAAFLWVHVANRVVNADWRIWIWLRERAVLL